MIPKNQGFFAFFLEYFQSGAVNRLRFINNQAVLMAGRQVNY